MNAQIERIYETGIVIGTSGKKYPLHSHIDPEEGMFLHKIIAADLRVCRTLEVGCAYGLSSLHICLATSSRSLATHTIIDPFQYSQWDGVGVKNLKDSGLNKFHLIEEPSELALPALLRSHEFAFDFVFIDGWHTFDHTLLDCFYATRLLRVGGYLAIDDAAMPGVRLAVDYLAEYPCYSMFETLGEDSRMVVLRKVDDDCREWYWYPGLA